MNEDKSQAQDGINEVKQAVARHSVCYEVWPEYAMNKGQRIAIGFSLELYGTGTHEHDFGKLTPGCKRCVETYQDLHRISEWILPRDERPSRYELSSFDGSLHESKTRQSRPEIELAIRILHRHDFFRPVDACEERCLKEMEEKLQQLGIRREH